MVMNGREVVVIDSELFSQILDEIQFLKMKLSQLTEVIEVIMGHTLHKIFLHVTCSCQIKSCNQLMNMH